MSRDIYFDTDSASVWTNCPKVLQHNCLAVQKGAIVMPFMKHPRRLRPYYTPHRGDLIAGLARVVVSTGSTGAAPWLVRVAIDAAPGAALPETKNEKFPAGHETLPGERGINLSGGQMQRAPLARHLARRLSAARSDDAPGAVDTHTEAEILRAPGRVLQRRAAAIASHRVSAVRDASWIIVLDEGQIVEQGPSRPTHDFRRTLLDTSQTTAARGRDRARERRGAPARRTRWSMSSAPLNLR